MNGVCDHGSDNASASVTVLTPAGELEFCAHHGRELFGTVVGFDNTAVIVTAPPVPVHTSV